MAAVGDVAAELVLVGVIDDDVVDPEALRSLGRMGPAALKALRQAGLPESPSARSRVSWLLGRHAEDLTVAEIDWLARGLAGSSPPEAMWALARVYERQPTAAVNAVRPLLECQEAVIGAWAFLAFAYVRDPMVEATACAMARVGAGAPRQMALQYLGRIESSEALALIAGLLRNASADSGDRAAAALAVSFHRAGRVQCFDELAVLLESDDIKLVRAALQALSRVSDVPESLKQRIRLLTNSQDYDVSYLAWLSVGAR